MLKKAIKLVSNRLRQKHKSQKTSKSIMSEMLVCKHHSKKIVYKNTDLATVAGSIRDLLPPNWKNCKISINYPMQGEEAIAFSYIKRSKIIMCPVKPLETDVVTTVRLTFPPARSYNDIFLCVPKGTLMRQK